VGATGRRSKIILYIKLIYTYDILKKILTLYFRADSGVGIIIYYTILIINIYGVYILYRREFASEINISVNI
jgi:hypothetical protein